MMRLDFASLLPDTIPELAVSEQEDDLRRRVQALVENHSTGQKFWWQDRAHAAVDRDLTRELIDAILDTWRHDAFDGGDLRGWGVVSAELGKTAAPVPFLSFFWAHWLLRQAGVASDQGSFRHVGMLADATRTPFDAFRPSLTGRRDASGAVVSGTVENVLDLDGLDVAIAPTVIDGEPAIAAFDELDVTAVRESRTQSSVDITRPLQTYVIDSAHANVVMQGDDVPPLFDQALWSAISLLASEQVGLCEAAITSLTSHLSERRQFGRPLGSFQALQHRLADLWVATVAAKATSRYALLTAKEGRPDIFSTSVARARCSTAAVLAAEESVQLHGGVGDTWEHRANPTIRRAIGQSLVFGPTHRYLREGVLAHAPFERTEITS